MIQFYVNGNMRESDEVTPTWLREQIESRREAGESVCVEVILQSAASPSILRRKRKLWVEHSSPLRKSAQNKTP